MAKTKGATSARRTARVNMIVELILHGARRQAIIEKFTTDEGLCESTVDKDMGDARRLITASAAVHHEHEMGKALRRYELLFSKNMQVQDYKAALAAQKELCALIGLNAPQRHEISGPDKQPIQAVMQHTVKSLDELDAQSLSRMYSDLHCNRLGQSAD